MKNYFAFIDESGNSRQERFFGLGLLVVNDEIGSFYDAMKPYYDRVFANSKLSKLERIKRLEESRDYEQIAQIANSNKRFELKFKNINFSSNLVYKDLIEKYFQFPNVRFCALVIDRFELKKKGVNSQLEPWGVYINRAAMLLSNNIKNISPCKICILADDLTRPNNIKKTFEESLRDSINFRLNKKGIEDSIFGVARLESHSSLLLQIVDILLGCVMYDFKNEAGIISKKLKERQGLVVDKMKNILNANKLTKSNTWHKPNYFSVWKLKI
jgi:hypothetical protein